MDSFYAWPFASILPVKTHLDITARHCEVCSLNAALLPTLWTYLTLFIHFIADRHAACFQFWSRYNILERVFWCHCMHFCWVQTTVLKVVIKDLAHLFQFEESVFLDLYRGKYRVSKILNLNDHWTKWDMFWCLKKSRVGAKAEDSAELA